MIIWAWKETKRENIRLSKGTAVISIWDLALHAFENFYFKAQDNCHIPARVLRGDSRGSPQCILLYHFLITWETKLGTDVCLANHQEIINTELTHLASHRYSSSCAPNCNINRLLIGRSVIQRSKMHHYEYLDTHTTVPALWDAFSKYLDLKLYLTVLGLSSHKLIM